MAATSNVQSELEPFDLDADFSFEALAAVFPSLLPSLEASFLVSVPPLEAPASAVAAFL